MVAPPVLPVPPPSYAGTERVIAALIDELQRQGHDVTLFGPGDSTIEAEIVPTVERSLWAQGYEGDASAYVNITLGEAWAQHERFDVFHSHVEQLGFLFARECPTPVVTTLHGRLDAFGMPDLIDAFSEIPLVAISASQRRWFPDANWVGTIHHGLPLGREPGRSQTGSYLAFVGRVAGEKGIDDAIELARRTHCQLRVAAKVNTPEERELFDRMVQPAIDDGTVEFLGELDQPERDALYAAALATVMLGAWPEPFGLVAIESMATGTPVIARRAGALTEIVEHGITGFLVDDVTEGELAVRRVPQLNREDIRRRTVPRFSAARMTEAYEHVYRAVLARRGEDGSRRGGATRPDRRRGGNGRTATAGGDSPRDGGRFEASSGGAGDVGAEEVAG